MRQAGILAAAGIYALDNNIDRLKEDHIRAENFKNDLVKFFGEIRDKNMICDTNMVFFTDLSDKFKNIVPFFRKENILISNWSNNTLRIVFHLDIDEDAMRKTLETFQKFYDLLRDTYENYTNIYGNKTKKYINLTSAWEILTKNGSSPLDPSHLDRAGSIHLHHAFI